MLRKTLTILIVSLSVLALSNLAWSSALGTWDVQGTMKVTVRIPGYGSDTEATKFYDEFTFYSNGQFEMIDMGGTWTQTGKKFTVNLDSFDIEDYFEYYLGEYGLDVSVEVTTVSFTGTEQKNGTIKGKFTMSMNIYFYDLDTEGSIRVSANFSGVRTTAAGSYFSEESPSPSLKSLFWITREEILKAVQTDDVGMK